MTEAVVVIDLSSDEENQKERSPLVSPSCDKRKQLKLSDLVKSKSEKLQTSPITNRGIKRKISSPEEGPVQTTPLKQSAKQIKLESQLKKEEKKQKEDKRMQTEEEKKLKDAEREVQTTTPKQSAKQIKLESRLKKEEKTQKEDEKMQTEEEEKLKDNEPELQIITPKQSPKQIKLEPRLKKVEEKKQKEDETMETEEKKKLKDAERVVQTTTPKQPAKPRLKKEEEKKQKEDERKRREEEKKLRDAEREKKQQKKEEEKRKKEEERKQKEEEKKLKDAEREKKQQKREEEKRQKEEERKQKEEEKKLKDAEREKKQQEADEEKRRREEDADRQKERQRKEQEKFKSFFKVKKAASSTPLSKEESLEKKFRDFVITPNMVVAPITRTPKITDDIFAPTLFWTDTMAHVKRVMEEMRSKEKIGLCTEALTGDLEIISLSPKEVKVKRKILSFHDNFRPAYCGSWEKTSKIIGPRRPFALDKSHFDYDYDSDEDWEEEEEGEDISSEKEEEKEDEEMESDDDGFFVPHGYLSDDEGDEDCFDLSEEAKKKKIERRKKQFEDEQRSKERGILNARITGPLWLNEEKTDTFQHLDQFQAVWCEDNYDIDPFERCQPIAQADTSDSGLITASKRELPVEGYGMLIKFLHGSPMGMSSAVERFQEIWHSNPSRGKVSKKQLTKLIPTLLKKCMRPGKSTKLCWYASDQLLEEYGLFELKGSNCDMSDSKPNPCTFTPPSNSVLKFTKATTVQQDLQQMKERMQKEEQAKEQKQQELLQEKVIDQVALQQALKVGLKKRLQLKPVMPSLRD